MKTRWVIPAATVSAAILWPGNAHAITWTCYANTSWPMEQPDADWNAGLRPTWADCEAWRGGNPGPQYVWSYGPSAATTTSVPATTTTEPATTSSTTTTTSTTTTSTTTTTTPVPTETPPATTAPAPSSTTTTASVPIAATTTSAAPAARTSTTYHDATSTTQATTTQTTATIASTTSTSSSTTILPSMDPPSETIPTTTLVQTDGAAAQASKVIGAQLAPGVTPLQAESVLIVNVAMTTVSAISARRRNEKRN